ncbi:hypothetical protein BJV78DRAFT_1258726 [Lactifluus subvellereus]|nr:hypothetical protein BJV78DRAFT_1258726 [Lactifluus subvellereus]
MGRLPWTLANFPQGYVLLMHRSPRRVSPSKARRDFYLYGPFITLPLLAYAHMSVCVCVCLLFETGAPDVASFASPLEFVKHAEWLMRGAHRTLDMSRAPRCACKYCDCDGTNRKQSVISRELRAARARVDDDIDADVDGAHADAVAAEATAVVPTINAGNINGI